MPAGSGGVSIETVPILEPAGQEIGFLLPLPNWSLVHTCSVSAAEGLMPRPRGSVTRASLTLDW